MRKNREAEAKKKAQGGTSPVPTWKQNQNNSPPPTSHSPPPINIPTGGGGGGGSGGSVESRLDALERKMDRILEILERR